MYSFDKDQWPIVKIRFTEGTSQEESQAFLADIQQVLSRQQRFAVILETDGRSPLTPVERKYFAAWFKSQKAAMKKFCAGMARLSKNASFLEKLSLKALNATMPFAVTIAKSEQEAAAWLLSRI